MDLSRRDFFHIAAALGIGVPTLASAACGTPKRADEVGLKDIYWIQCAKRKRDYFTYL
jgi:S-sulfosulfanyl-L-cysteine sulfohydrolase